MITKHISLSSLNSQVFFLKQSLSSGDSNINEILFQY